MGLKAGKTRSAKGGAKETNGATPRYRKVTVISTASRNDHSRVMLKSNSVYGGVGEAKLAEFDCLHAAPRGCARLYVHARSTSHEPPVSLRSRWALHF